MDRARGSTGLPISAKVIRAILRSRLRGRTRLTLLLAGWHRSLQKVPLALPGGRILYLDLRIGSTHGFLIGSAWEVAEQEVMRHIVLPGDIAFDVGAHLGAHTVLLSQLVGPT